MRGYYIEQVSFSKIVSSAPDCLETEPPIDFTIIALSPIGSRLIRVGWRASI